MDLIEEKRVKQMYIFFQIISNTKFNGVLFMYFRPFPSSSCLLLLDFSFDQDRDHLAVFTLDMCVIIKGETRPSIFKMILLILLLVTCLNLSHSRLVSVSLHGGSKSLVSSLSASLLSPNAEDDIPIDVQIEVIEAKNCNSFVPVWSDLSVCFINRSDILDQDRAIKRIVQSVAGHPLNELPKENNTTVYEKPVFLVYEGPVGDHSFLNFLVRQAIQVDRVLHWRSKSGVYPRPHFLLLPVGEHDNLDADSLESFRKSFVAELKKIVSDEKSKMVNDVIVERALPLKRPNLAWDHSKGIEFIDSALHQVMLRFREAFKNGKLRSDGTLGPVWAKDVDDQLQISEADLAQLVDSCSPDVRRIGFELLRRQLIDTLKPVFRETLDHLMRDILRSFNEEVLEKSEFSGSLSSLMNLRNKCIETFARTCKAANPKYFSTGFVVMARNRQTQLERIFDDYLRDRKITMQSQLLLPHRDRPPLDVSVHLFFSHPFGLDHRQNVLSSADAVILDESLAVAQSFEEHRLKSTLHQVPSLRTDPMRVFFSSIRSRKLRENHEFVREMLMLPLSMRTRWLSKVSARNSMESTNRNEEVPIVLNSLTQSAETMYARRNV